MNVFTQRALRTEWLLYSACSVLWAVACAGPQVAQHAHYHAFADQRALWGVPHALDVLSNLPFALAGGWGLCVLRRWMRPGQGMRAGKGVGMPAESATSAGLCGLFFAGLLLTAGGSSLYHWQPHDATLLWDRAGMLVAFAGVAGLAVAGRIGPRPAWVVTLTMLVAGVLALRSWQASGQFLPWAVVQGGGMLLVASLAFRPQRPEALPVSLAAVIGWYALAKLLEWGDHAVWEWTQGVVSGHSLKHVAAALSAWPVIAALHATRADRPASHAARRTGPYFARCVRVTTWRRPAAGTPQLPAQAAATPACAGTMAAGVTPGAASPPTAPHRPHPLSTGAKA